MVNNKIEKIRASLKNYNYFQECIIEEVRFKDYLTTLEISLNNIWTKKGTIRKNIDHNKNIVFLIFRGLENLKIQNYLTNELKINLEQLNWGFNEISVVKVENTSNDLMKLSLLWENDRRIEIIFDEFELIS